MNWLNLNVTVLDSEEFLGAEPVERATWLCLLRYCAGQENGGRIEGAKLWKCRKWQQIVRVTLKEIEANCDLWKWDGDDLVVEFYPEEKEAEVKQRREVAKTNGARGGRPKKSDAGTRIETREETQKKPASVHSSKAEGEREGEGEREVPPNPLPEPKPDKPLVSLETALGYAPMARMSPKAVEHWWHTRNAAGWTRSTASGGHPRRITSWQSDMTASRDWAEEAAAKAPTGSTPKPSRCL